MKACGACGQAHPGALDLCASCLRRDWGWLFVSFAILAGLGGGVLGWATQGVAGAVALALIAAVVVALTGLVVVKRI